jgi:tetratricopeptide (TPR) repeat protein
MAYVDCEEWEIAGECYQEATDIAEELGDLPLMAGIYINRAEFFLNIASMVMAKTYCSRALDIFQKLDDKLGIAEAYKLNGRINKQEQDWDTAEQHFKESIKLYQECNNLLGIAEAHYEFGLMYNEKQEFESAKAHSENSLKLFEQLKATEEIEKVQSTLANLQ